MSQFQDAFLVTCPIVPALNGQYVYDRKNYYLQDEGNHILAKHTNGVWGVGDGKNYLAVSNELHAISPAEVRSWKYLLGGSYKPCPDMKITRQQQLPTPPVQQKTDTNAGPKPGDSVADQVRTEKDYDAELAKYRTSIEALQRDNAAGKTKLADLVTSTAATEASLRATITSLQSNAAADKSAISQMASAASAKEAKALENERTLSATVQQLKDALQAAQARLTSTSSIVPYVKRDAAASGSAFPCGAEFKKEFETTLTFADFEGFAYDMMNCLEDMGHHAEHVAADMFVQQVMLPMHSVVQQHVEGLIRAKHAHMQALSGVAVWSDGQATVSTEDSEAKRFFFTTLQASLLAKMQYIDDSSVTALISTMGPLVGTLHTAMACSGSGGGSSSGRELINRDLSIETLVKLLLRLHTVAALSDPRCYLHPAPGVRLSYKELLHQEILSPGAKRYGHIKEGDLVEVVLPGLYFDQPPDYKATSAGQSISEHADAVDGGDHSSPGGEGLIADPVAPSSPSPVVGGNESSSDAVMLHASLKPIVPCLVRRLVGLAKIKAV